jgi:hypothetical protein
MMERFSKKTLAQFLVKEIAQHSYDADNGRAQVKGRGESRNLEYGRYEAYRDLMDRFELWDHVAERAA